MKKDISWIVKSIDQENNYDYDNYATELSIKVNREALLNILDESKKYYDEKINELKGKIDEIYNVSESLSEIYLKKTIELAELKKRIK